MFEETTGGLIEIIGNTGIAGPRALTEDVGPQRILLPWGSAETRFAPRQCYYLASKSGVVPSWAITTPGQANARAPSWNS